MLVEKGAYISNIWEVLLNSKKEWQQAKIIRTTTKVVQGGADVLRKEGGAWGGRRGTLGVQATQESQRPRGQKWPFLINMLIRRADFLHQEDLYLSRRALE